MAPLAPGDYVAELLYSDAGRTVRQLVAFRVIR